MHKHRLRVIWPPVCRETRHNLFLPTCPHAATEQNTLWPGLPRGPTAPGVTEVLFSRASNSSGAVIESVHLIIPCDLQGSAPCKVLHAPGGEGISVRACDRTSKSLVMVQPFFIYTTLDSCWMQYLREIRNKKKIKNSSSQWPLVDRCAIQAAVMRQRRTTPALVFTTRSVKRL